MGEIEIIDCEEFGALQIGVSRLMVDGQIALDPRIVDRGYLNVSLSRGQVVFRADRYVGLIPVNNRISIRVRPRALIGNIAQMIVRSGVAPAAIPDFSRGYMPRFETGAETERIYCTPLVGGVERILENGMMKSYVQVPNPPAWRGRFLVSDTIKRHRARNVRYRSEFDYKELAYGGVENVALNHSLKVVQRWLTAQNDNRHAELAARCGAALARMTAIPNAGPDIGRMVQEIGRSAARLPLQYSYYRAPLWNAYLLLQSKLPDMSSEGFVNLDSLVVDLSKVFEAFVRTVLVERADGRGWRVVDGNLKPFSFFAGDNAYNVHPDIVVTLDGKPVALLDAKYKLDPKEADRYELLSFMDTVGVTRGAFVCPQRSGAHSRYMGRTIGGKEISLLRFDLAAADVEVETDRFVENVAKLAAGDHGYL